MLSQEQNGHKCLKQWKAEIYREINKGYQREVPVLFFPNFTSLLNSILLNPYNIKDSESKASNQPNPLIGM